MPNYCTNILTVTGDEKEISRFLTTIKQGELQDHEHFRILDNLLPTPKELSNTVKGHFDEDTDEYKKNQKQRKVNLEKFGAPDWYDWNCKNYGSKWSDFEGQINKQTNTELVLSFMTAWSPICEGIRNVSVLFPTLDFVLLYSEGGMAFLGGVALRQGALIAEIEGEYPQMTEEQLEADDYEGHWEVEEARLNEIEGILKKALSVSV